MPRRRRHGQGTLFRQGKIWHFQISIQGKKQRRSLHTTDRETAEAQAARIVEEARLLAPSLENSPTVRTAALDEVARLEADTSPSQATRAAYAFAAFEAYVGDIPIALIDLDGLEAYQRHRLLSRARATVEKEIALIRRMLAEHDHPIAKPKAKRGRRTVIRAFTRDELARFLAATTDHFYALYSTALYTGARPTELVPSSTGAQHSALLKTEIDLEGPSILIRTAKGHRAEATRPRRIPIPEDLADLLADQIAANPGPYVFPKCSNLARAFNATLQRAGIDKTTQDGTLDMRSFRHTYGTLQAAEGVESFNLANVMGHAKTSTTQRYIDAAQTRAPILHVPIPIRRKPLGEESTKAETKGSKKGSNETEKPAEKAG